MGISIKPIIRKQAFRSDGTTAIYICLTIDSKPQYKVTDVVIHKSNFRDRRPHIKEVESLSINKNMALNAIMDRMELKKYELITAGKAITYDQLFNAAERGTFVNFLEYATEAIQRRPVKQRSRESLTIMVNHFETFSPGLSLQDITPAVIDRFKSYLKNKNYSHNYQVQVLSKIRSIVLDAVKNKALKENPFDFITVGSYRAKQEHLTFSEFLHIIDKLPTLSKGLQKVCKRFCFCCSTSFRFSDAATLDYSSLRKHQRGYYFEVTQHKTSDKVLVPLNDFALQFLDLSQTAGPVFDDHTHQYTNRALKTISEALDVGRVLTTHVARHTFITVTQELGGSKDVAGKIAGHKSESTTAGYSHYSLDVMFDAVEKWNKAK